MSRDSDGYSEPSAEENLAAAEAGLAELEEARLLLRSPRLQSAPNPTLPSWLIPRSALALEPSPTSLIDQTLDCGTVAVLAGPTGTAKSLLAVQWGVAVASGGQWLDRPSKSGPVVFVAAEGASGLQQRLEALEKYAGHGVPDSFLVVRGPINLGNAKDVSEFVDGVVALRPRMVIIDTLARCMVGHDENSAQAMGIVLDNAYRIRDALDGGVVLLVHHTGKDGSQVRGSSALESGADTVYRTSRGRGGLIQLARAKRKDGPPEDRVSFSLTEVASSVVLTPATGQAPDTRPTPARPPVPGEDLRRSILRVIDAKPGQLRITDVRSQVRGQTQRVSDMIKRLEEEGSLLRSPAGRFLLAPQAGRDWV